MKIINRFFVFFLISSVSYGTDRYYLCGPDEDGCFSKVYQYCACIPFNDLDANTPHCLDFATLTCKPISQIPQCVGSTFKNQGECLATMLQSEPEPLCKTVSRQFCYRNHIPICDMTGQPSSCH